MEKAALIDTNNHPKRLIEVDLPIKRISAHARREKSIRHGHISTLHIWWARRPLAACRAVICAALWPDPANEHCPQAFREKAAELITAFAIKATSKGELTDSCSQESIARWLTLAKPENHLDLNNPSHLNVLRFALLDFIADFANWDNSTKKEYLEASRALTQAAHEALGGDPGTKPLVVDPFAGGGAIPLEALRVGADAFASDLNPVAVLLNKVVLEYIPKYGQRLADEVRKWGEWIKKEAEKELAKFYPRDPDGATPIAYLWARTITCEGPGCGAEVPLMRSFWLAKKGNRSVALRIISRPKAKQVEFEIIENAQIRDISEGTVRRGSATCPACGFTTPVGSVRQQLRKRRGGAVDARLFCVVMTRPGAQGRFYRLPNEKDWQAAYAAAKELERCERVYKGKPSMVPNERYPDETGSGALSSSVVYGPRTWGDLFIPRQALALTMLVKLVRIAGEKMTQEGETGLALAVQTCLAMTVDRAAEHGSSLCRWNANGEKLQATFGRQALPMTWDVCETNPFGSSVGSLSSLLELVQITIKTASYLPSEGTTAAASATIHSLPNDFAQGFFTDPPYYDAIAYGDLSDFFFVWLKRTIGDLYPSLFSSELVDKTDEIVHLSQRFRGPYSHKTKEYFEKNMQLAMEEGRRVLAPDGVGIVVFAHKSTGGWEAMLQAMVDAGWVMTGSWPIDTEMGTRMNAMGAATLASSIHLVCRPRENADGSLRTDDIGDWRDVLAELPKRIHEWMPHLAAEGVVGADAIFACLGPALEIFSRHSRVEKASGERVTLKEYLELVWAAVAREALNMIFEGADATGFEEDARLTAMWLWTLSTGTSGNGSGDSEAESEEDEEASSKEVKTSGFVLEYDAARKIAQGLGAHLEHLASLVEVKGDKARLLLVSERTRALFGKDEGKAPAKRKKKSTQLTLFGALSAGRQALGEIEEEGDGWGEKNAPQLGNTVLDRIHQSMILFAAGRSEALKRFLVEDGVGRDRRFWRLAQALSALYPAGTDEKRWVDGVLARKKGLGF